MREVNGFGAIVADVWNRGLWGTTIGDILIAIGIVVVAVLVRKIFANLVTGRLRAITARTRNQVDDVIVDAIAPPLQLVPVIFGLYLAFRFVEPDPAAWIALMRVIRSLVAFVIFWGIYRAIMPAGRVLSPLQGVVGAETLDWVVKAVRLVIVFIGAAVILEMWGIEVGPLLAGLGLFGVAVALGAQDLFKNLIAGMAILSEKRFAKGEAIVVDGVVEGAVESIGFRSSLIRTWDKVPVYVPNAQMADNAVSNISRRSQRRINWLVGVEYRTTGAQLRTIRDRIEAWILGNELFAQPPDSPVVVRIDALNASSIDILVQCFTAADINEWREAKQQLILALKDIVEGEGSGFAFPSQSVYVESMPRVRPSNDDGELVELGEEDKPPQA
ncbi:MAG: mechanosensitive ion channel [Alphaproteobacteria bacterium]|nr:mechanosensitive ion channel [Alphaproteobacteria bacterium]